MTKKRAERITGLEILPVDSNGPRGKTWRAMEGETEIARVTEPNDEKAWARLVLVLYQRRSQQAFEEQNFRCLLCGGFKALQSHHIRPRSHGRSDERSNLCGLCPEDHKDVTDNRKAFKPLPTVLQIVFENSGLRLGDNGWA